MSEPRRDGLQCPACERADLVPEHAHLRCPRCHYIAPCCSGELE